MLHHAGSFRQLRNSKEFSPYELAADLVLTHINAGTLMFGGAKTQEQVFDEAETDEFIPIHTYNLPPRTQAAPILWPLDLLLEALPNEERLQKCQVLELQERMPRASSRKIKKKARYRESQASKCTLE